MVFPSRPYVKISIYDCSGFRALVFDQFEFKELKCIVAVEIDGEAQEDGKDRRD